jgi:hypothetical protein
MKKILNHFRRLFFTAGCSILFLAGCLPGSSASAITPTQDAFFKPPTLPVPEETAALVAGGVKTSLPTPSCQNGLAFIADITIPDGTLVTPGSFIDKTWEVENTGTCGWTADYSLRHVGGSNLGAETTLPLYPARAGARALITIRFTAPAESGTIHSAWRAYGPDDQPFGDAVYVQMIVSGAQP